MLRPLGRTTSATSPRPPERQAHAASRPFELETPASPAAQAGQAPPPSATLSRALESLDMRRREIDRLIERSVRGQTLSAQQLLIWQARVYDYSQRMELLSRVVDRSVAAVKTTLNTPV